MWIRVVLSCRKPEITFIPFEKKGKGICVSDNPNILKDLEERSQKIKRKEFVQQEWDKLCIEQEETLLLRGVLGIRSRILLKLNRTVFRNIMQKYFTKSTYRRKMLYNFLRCESIRESLITLLEDKDI